MSMLSSASLTCHMWGNGVEGNVSEGVEAKRDCGEGAADSQHGTDVEGSSHPCTKGYHPNYFKGLFIFYFDRYTCADNSLYMYVANIFCAIYIFLLCRIKINHVTEV